MFFRNRNSLCLFAHERFDGHVGGNQCEAELVEQDLFQAVRKTRIPRVRPGAIIAQFAVRCPPDLSWRTGSGGVWICSIAALLTSSRQSLIALDRFHDREESRLGLQCAVNKRG